MVPRRVMIRSSSFPHVGPHRDNIGPHRDNICMRCHTIPQGHELVEKNLGGHALQSDRVLRNCWPPNAIYFET
jgi:hypothetical protein